MKEKTIKKQLMADLLLIFQLEHREEAEDKEVDEGPKRYFTISKQSVLSFFAD